MSETQRYLYSNDDRLDGAGITLIYTLEVWSRTGLGFCLHVETRIHHVISALSCMNPGVVAIAAETQKSQHYICQSCSIPPSTLFHAVSHHALCSMQYPTIHFVPCSIPPCTLFHAVSHHPLCSMQYPTIHFVPCSIPPCTLFHAVSHHPLCSMQYPTMHFVPCSIPPSTLFLAVSHHPLCSMQYPTMHFVPCSIPPSTLFHAVSHHPLCSMQYPTMHFVPCSSCGNCRPFWSSSIQSLPIEISNAWAVNRDDLQAIYSPTIINLYATYNMQSIYQVL